MGENGIFYGQITNDFKLEFGSIETNAAVYNYIGDSNSHIDHLPHTSTD